MARDCIICGQPAGSAEHIFPAALGGRRTNKGIYCHNHNQGFSPLASILTQQLRHINALLSVHPDHGTGPTVAIAEGANGQKIEVTGNKLKPILPKPDTPIGGEPQQVAFATRADADRWIAEQRAAGVEVKVTSIERQRHYSSGHLRMSLTLGGAEGLRAIGYIALTFLGHHFPELVRLVAMKEFKNYVVGIVAEKKGAVWWEAPDKNPPENPFRFGHTIQILTSASTGHAFARVALFSALCFAVDFGNVGASENFTVTTHIDPLATRAPDDMRVEKLASATYDASDTSTEGLRQVVQNGVGEQRFNHLIRDILEFNLERDGEDAHKRLAAMSDRLAPERENEIKNIVREQAQRVFNHMTRVITELNGTKSGGKDDALIEAMAKLAETDAGSSSGLTPATEAALEAALAKMEQEIAGRYDSITANELAMLFGGGPGMALVGGVIRDLALSSLG